MDDLCLICDTQDPTAIYCKNIFVENKTLPSGNNLIEVLQEIIKKPLEDTNVHSKALCKKCFKTCGDYDDLKSIMTTLKHKMSHDYTTTLKRRTVELVSQPTTPDKRGKTIIVPASKLQPVPADFQLDFGQLTAVTRANMHSRAKPATPLINLKVTIGSSVFTQSLKTSTVKIGKPIESDNTILTNTNTMMSTSKENEYLNILPQDIFVLNENQDGHYEIGSENIEEHVAGNKNNDGENENHGGGNDEDADADNEKDVENDNEHEMEIDEDCSSSVMPASSQSQDVILDTSNIKTESTTISDDTQYINVNMLPSVDGTDNNGKFVVSNLKIFNQGNDDNDDEQHTIVVDSDNASILEMMSGQKLIYENGELQLVMQDDDANENDDDGQDSNDESQIELQVSGDEETANAIIAAAQEQGGAFIKVESGEMYRVKSVQSKASQGFDVSFYVTKHGNKFKCVICEKNDRDEMSDAATMMKHLKTHHDAKIYICLFCGIGMRKRQDYTRHIAEHSKKLAQQKGALKTKLHECDKCKKTYNSRTLLQEHMNTHNGVKPYQCEICDKAFASKYTHQAHLKTHQNRPRPYKCRQCSKSFLSVQNLAQHEKTHSGSKNFICKVCNKAFGTQHNLEVHGVVHTGARPFGCDFCSKAFARRAELTDHVRIHTGERPFECEICGARFAQRSNLHSHRRATHLDDKRHACQHCSKRFKRRRLLEYHIKASHTGERPLKCEVCHSTFVYPEHYKKHMRIHSGERPYFCEICGKSFNSRDNRNTHRFTHSEKKPYECLSCGQSYMRKRLLIAHMNSSGHLAESIVVNQPRVTRVDDNGVTTIVNLNDNSDDEHEGNETVFRTSGKLELLEEDDKIKDEEDGATKLFISSEDLETENADATLLETVHASEIDSQTQLTTDESGSVLRLIQVQLPDGNDGWVALND